MADLDLAKKVCGIIRPISDVDGYPRGHWENVHNIIVEVAGSLGLEPRVVSDANEASIIHRNIASNIIENDIIVCDVSSLNANVMLELGLRLALGKAVVVIKDDKTKYSFDTSPIEHVGYPASLHYYDVIAFKSKLKDKIDATLKNYHPFFTAFGPIEVPTPQRVDVPALDMLMGRIDTLSRQVSRLGKQPNSRTPSTGRSIELRLSESISDDQIKEITQSISEIFPKSDFYIAGDCISFRPGSLNNEKLEEIKGLVRNFMMD